MLEVMSERPVGTQGAATGSWGAAAVMAQWGGVVAVTKLSAPAVLFAPLPDNRQRARSRLPRRHPHPTP
jgi:hypothetical protein